MNTEFKKINDLCDQNRLEDAEKIIENLLKLDSYNTDLWLRLAVLETLAPLSYYPKAIESLNRILEYDNNNFEAILLLICVNYYEIGIIEEELICKIDNIVTDNKEKLSMLEYVKALYYERIDENIYVECLQKSIQLYPYHVLNFIKVAEYYQSKKYYRIKKMYQMALKNVKFVSYMNMPDDNYDCTSVENYFNEFVKGIFMPAIHYEDLKKLSESI